MPNNKREGFACQKSIAQWNVAATAVHNKCTENCTWNKFKELQLSTFFPRRVKYEQTLDGTFIAKAIVTSVVDAVHLTSIPSSDISSGQTALRLVVTDFLWRFLVPVTLFLANDHTPHSTHFLLVQDISAAVGVVTSLIESLSTFKICAFSVSPIIF